MTQFTTDIVQALVQKQDITDVFRFHLETAVNTLLTTERTAFSDYEKHDRIGFNSGNSRNGTYARTLHTEYGDLEILIPRDDRNGEFNQQTVAPYKRSNDTLEFLCYPNVSVWYNDVSNHRFNRENVWSSLHASNNF